MKGNTGPEGPLGLKGEKGEKGTTGNEGQRGATGLPGLPGSKGEVGTKGEDGHQGAQGVAGDKGEKGNSIIGPMGLPGLQGVMGPPGPPGTSDVNHRISRVESGPPGVEGPQGPKGQRGERGPVGFTGYNGTTGLKGAAGEPGNPGLSVKGEKGNQGIIGERGYPGDQGPKGVGGPQGRPGPRGEPGKPASSELRAHIIHTRNDMQVMTDMFETGVFVFVSAEESLFLKSVTGWLQVLTKDANSDNVIEKNHFQSGPTVSKKLGRSDDNSLSLKETHKKQRPTPGAMDVKLLHSNLILPKEAIFVQRPYLLLMAMNHPVSGKMGGISGADHKCWKQANDLGLDGTTFRAFLSDRYISIKHLMSENNAQHLPITNFKGERIFENYESIFNTSGYAAFNNKITIYSFEMRNVREDDRWPIKKIWHGSRADGSVYIKSPCKNWRSSSPVEKATAASLLTYTPALNEELTHCNNKLIGLCIQISLR